MKNSKLRSNLKHDIPASSVVFFVALPLCLGIALASGAPLFSGLIGGIVVGSLSASQEGVSGPAAGLVATVLSAIGSLGSYESFLLAVILAGIIQCLRILVQRTAKQLVRVKFWGKAKRAPNFLTSKNQLKGSPLSIQKSLIYVL
jgi:MFS superfamily sulfate permease-like transporter